MAWVRRPLAVEVQDFAAPPHVLAEAKEGTARVGVSQNGENGWEPPKLEGFEGKPKGNHFDPNLQAESQTSGSTSLGYDAGPLEAPGFPGTRLRM